MKKIFTLALISMFCISAWSTDVTMRFDTRAGLTAMGLSDPGSDKSKTFTQGEQITQDEVTVTMNTANVKLTHDDEDDMYLNIPANGNISISVPEGKKITGVKFGGENEAQLKRFAFDDGNNGGEITKLERVVIDPTHYSWEVWWEATQDVQSLKLSANGGLIHVYWFTVTFEEAAPEPISNLAVVGSFQDPEWDTNNGVEMAMTDNNVFVAEVTFPAGTLFKLIEKLDTHINWYGGAAESDVFWVSPEIIENGTEMDLVDGSNFKIDDAGTYIISVDANTRKMTVTAKPVEAKYYVAGGFNGWSTSENELEAQEDVYTATIDVLGEDEESRSFKIVRVDNATTWFGGADDAGQKKFIITEELLGKEITLLEGAGENLLLPAAGNYTFNLILADAAAPAGMAKAEGQAFKLVVVKNDVTGVETINAEDIAAVKYVNMAGQVSATPFEGVNVKVI
ncbi:MAG: SusF/SusE family outer membrane protein, partial [Muribaculaceae bacterium]|nr:SusF/SusE family outer membrane protein [Muribaculaceae bacterium]